MNFNKLQKNKFGTLAFSALVFLSLVFGIFAQTQAAFNPTINYQGKLTNGSAVAVPDGDYDMEFSLYTSPTGGSPVWTETLTGSDQVPVLNGLFSVMLGSTTPLTSVDFNQTLYLGVSIEADAEMTPRKILGAVPAAFEAENAQTVGGVASTSFLRSDQADVATGLLTFSNGFLSQASSSIARLTTITATTTNLVINSERFTDLTGTGLQNSSGVLTLNTTYLNTLYASTTAFDTSAELRAILTDETGTGNAVFSASPTFTGTLQAAAGTFSSVLTSPYFNASGATTTILSFNNNSLFVASSTLNTIALGFGAEISSSSTAVDAFFVGRNAGLDAVNAEYSNFIGYYAGAGATNALRSNFIGINAGRDAVNAEYSNFIGDGAGDAATNANVSNFIGNDAGSGATNAFESNFFGVAAGSGAVDAVLSNFFGSSAGSDATDAFQSNFFGSSAGSGATFADDSNFFGYAAGQDAVNADQSNFLGGNAGRSATNAMYSNFLGDSAGMSATNASYANFLGTFAGRDAINAATSSFLGYRAGYGATNAANSLFLGTFAGLSDTVNNTSNGGSSIAIGRYAGTGGFSNSIALGRGVINSAATQLNIGNTLYATGIYNSDTQSAVPGAGLVGIGTSTPSQELTVAGDARITGRIYDSSNSAGTNGMVLKSTGTGFTWVATSTLGFGTGNLSSTDIDTCSELAAIIAGETGTCGSLVLSVSPTFTGTVQAAAATLSSALTFSGSSGQIVKSGTAAGQLDIDFPNATSTSQNLRLFRNTNTTGSRFFTIYKGDGSSTAVLQVTATSGALTINGQSSDDNLLRLRGISAAGERATMLFQNHDGTQTYGSISAHDENDPAHAPTNHISIETPMGDLSTTITRLSILWGVDQSEVQISNADLLLDSNEIQDIGNTTSYLASTTWQMSGANGINGSTLLVSNTTNGAVDAPAIIEARVGGNTTTGDPQLRLSMSGGNTWHVGVDNSNSDLFVIGTSTTVGAAGTSFLTISTAGVVTVAKNSASLVLGDGTNNSVHVTAAGGRTMFGYNGANAVVQGGTSKGILFNVNNASFGSGNAAILTSGGNFGIATTTPSQKLTVVGNAYITGALYDSSNSAGTNGMVLKSTGTGFTWVATSTLGFGTGNLSSTDIDTYAELDAIVGDAILTHNGLIDTSAELLAIVTDETGTGALVFGTSPTFTTSALSPIFASTNADVADAGVLRLGNAESIGWEASPTGTDVTLTVSTSEVLTSSAQFQAPSLRLDSSTTGVLLDSDGDGMLIIQGQSAGFDEDIRINLDDVADEATFTSTTGVVTANFSGIALQESGSAVLSVADTDTSAELLAIVTDETGTGRLVFSNAPAFSGTATFSALTATSTLTMSGTAANIALGSNFLSGDGGDEGVFVDANGNVGIGTTTPAAKLQVLGTTEQFRSGYDASNYLSVTTGSTGTTTFNAVGTSPSILFTDSQFQLQDNTDPTKRVEFQLSGISAGTKSIWAFPAGTGTFVGLSQTQTLTNKTLTSPNITGSATTSNLYLSGRLLDTAASAGTNGYILRSTGTSTRWVATSTLGFGAGSVSSVGLSAPTGFSVSGSPVTSSGVLALSYAAGYEGLRTASSTNWNSFYNTPSTRITDGTGLTWSGNTLNCDTASGSAVGCLSTADWTSFNGKVATSSINSLAEIESLTGVTNILIENDIDASSELLALMDDETGTGRLVFSNAPAFSGTATFSALTATSTLIGQTTIQANTGFIPDADGGAYLGQGTTAFSGLFLDTGATINFDNSNVVLTHSSGILTVGTGDLRVTTAGTNAASVVTVGGTQTLTSKTLTSPILTTPTLGVASATSLNTSGMATSSSLTVTGLTSALLLTNANGTAAEYTGTACTGTQLVRSLSALGVATCGSGAIATSTALAANQIVYGTAAGTIGSEAAFLYNATTNIFSADTVTANTAALPDADGGADLGSGTVAWDDLFLDTGATINFDNGNSVITHSSAVLTVSTGDLRVTTAGTNAASVVTVGGTQTLTAKTLTSPSISAATLSGVTTFSGLTASRGLFLDSSSRATTTALSASLLNSLTDETGTGRLTFSNAPAFSGTATFSALTATSTLTMSGTAANIALGSNFLSGDGGDEGVSIATNGDLTLTGASADAFYINMNEGSGYPTFYSNSDSIDIGANTNIIDGFSFSISDNGNDRFGYLEVENDGATVLGNSAGNLAFMPVGGMVGIGTTSPIASLHVTGNAIIGREGGDAGGADSLSVGSSAWAYGSQSFAAGNNAIANADYTSAIGYIAGAYGFGSAAFGFNSQANGDFSMSLGSAMTGSGYGGNGEGLHAMAIGLGDMTGVRPMVTGTSSLGIFLGDQSGLELSAEQVMAIMGGNVGIGTTTPSQELTIIGDARITGRIYDSSNSAGTNGMVLKSTGTGFTWVATSTLGITGGGGLTSADINTSAEIAAIVGDETGSGRLTFSNAPAFSGTATFSALTATSTLTMSGTAANIALGSNFLSGDGGDEGVFVDANGNVGIGDTTPDDLLNIHSASAAAQIAITSLGTNTDPSVGFQLADGTNTFTMGIDDSDSDSFKISGSALGTSDYFTITSAGWFGMGADTVPDSFVHMLADSGDTVLTIEADDSNGTEADNAYISFQQDGETTEAFLGFGQAITGVIDENTFVINQADSSGHIMLATNDIARLTIDSSGNIGIGDTTPSQILDVEGTSAQGLFEESTTEFLRAGVGETSNTSILGWDDSDTMHFGVYDSPTDSTISSLMSILSTGRVGIGTTTPNQKLSIFASAADAAIEFSTVSGANEKWTIGIDDSDSAKFKISSSSALGTNDRLVIDGRGYVGIGTSNPSQTLDVDANTNTFVAAFSQFDNGTLGGSGLYMYVNRTDGNGYALQYENPSGTQFALKNDGRLGIGTTTPNQALSIFRSGADAAISFGTVSGANEKWTIGIDDSDSAKFKISSSTALGTSDRLVINGAGYVGIGTASPVSLIHVTGGTSGDAVFRLEADTDNNGSGDNPYIDLYQDGAGTQAQIGFASIAGQAFNDATMTGALANAFLINSETTGSAGVLQLATEDTVRLTILASGLMGIGTTTPTQELSVTGDLQVTGRIYDSANSAGTNGMVLKSTGTGFTWVATSTLGLSGLTSTSIDTSSELAAIVGDETGSGRLVFSSAPAFSGTATFSALTATSTLTLSGTAANIALGSNYLSGDGGDEGVFVNSSGLVGIGTSTPSTKFMVYQTGGSSTDGMSVGNSQGATGRLYIDTNNVFVIQKGTQTNQLVLDNNSRVGIGTTTPNQKLSIFASAADAAIEFSTVSGANEKWTIGIDDSDGAKFKISSSSALGTNDRLVINGAGYVGIGDSTPDMLLDVEGSTAGNYLSNISNNSATGYGQYIYINNAVTTTHALGIDNSGGAIFRVRGDGNVGIGTTTPSSKLAMQKTGMTGSGVAGIHQYFTYTNSTLDAVYYGDNSYLVNTPTATSTLVGKMLKIEDSTTKGNTVRGMEVQAHRGTNTQGENTGVSAFGRTFGLRGTTEGDAGGVFQPAGVFAQTRGTTQGNALRAYSASITTEDLVSLFQDTSAFTGTGLEMNFGNSGGSFSSSSSKFVDFKNAGTSKFTVKAHGMTTIGDGTTSNAAGLQIGYGGLCVDNDGTCTASTTGRITSVSSSVGNSDLAEMYFSSQDLQPGDIVYTTGILSIGKASDSSKDKIIGVVSTKPGLTLGFDDTSLTSGQAGYPVALSGRVPIRLSTENGPIKEGDKIALSSIPGVGMKATAGGTVVGIALEDFDGEFAYSAGFIDQFGDDIAEPDTEPTSQTKDERIHDGCYFGGGSELGEEECVARNTERFEEVEFVTSDESEEMQEALLDLAGEDAEEMETPEGVHVAVGQALMFVNLGWHQTVEEQTVLTELTSTSTDLVLDGDGEETLWNRLKTLAQGFVDGVLSVAGLRAENVYVENQLCVDGVCVTADDLRALLESVNHPSEGSGDGEPVDPPPAEEGPEPEEGGGGTGELPDDPIVEEEPPETTEDPLPQEPPTEITEEETPQPEEEPEVTQEEPPLTEEAG